LNQIKNVQEGAGVIRVEQVALRAACAAEGSSVSGALQ